MSRDVPNVSFGAAARGGNLANITMVRRTGAIVLLAAYLARWMWKKRAAAAAAKANGLICRGSVKDWNFKFWERATPGTVEGCACLRKEQVRTWFWHAIRLTGEVDGELVDADIIEAVISAYFEEGERLGIKADVAFCHAVHETGWFKRFDRKVNDFGASAVRRACLGKSDEVSSSGRATPRDGVLDHLKALREAAQAHPGLLWNDIGGEVAPAMGRAVAALYRQCHYDTAYTHSCSNL